MSVLTALKMSPWVGILFLLGIVSVQGSRIHRFHEQAIHCAQARASDRASYENAQKAAKAQNDAQLARVKSEQEKITNETVSTLDARLGLIRSELRKASAAPQRPSSGLGAGNSSQAPCVASDPAWMCLSPDERLRAAENEERHDELIDWNLKQSAIDPNK